jgi:hypothetical protein
MNRVREALQDATVHAILVAGPDAATLGEIIDCLENLGSKSVGREQLPSRCHRKASQMSASASRRPRR